MQNKIKSTNNNRSLVMNTQIQQKKIMLTIANYSDWRQSFFNEHFKPRNEKFAQTHGYDYLLITEKHSFSDIRGGSSWLKFKIIQDMIVNHELKNDDVVFHLDADARIDKFELDFPCEKSASFAIDSGNTINAGIFKMVINDWSKKLVNNILDDEMWNDRKDDPLWRMWWEQAALYDLFGMIREPRHPEKSLFDVPNYGWNMAVTKHTKYGIGELHQNVQILHPEWNTTLLEEEFNETDPALMKYNINKVKKDSVRIRHFAGGQQWKTN